MPPENNPADEVPADREPCVRLENGVRLWIKEHADRTYTVVAECGIYKPAALRANKFRPLSPYDLGMPEAEARAFAERHAQPAQLVDEPACPECDNWGTVYKPKQPGGEPCARCQPAQSAADDEPELPQPQIIGRYVATPVTQPAAEVGGELPDGISVEPNVRNGVPCLPGTRFPVCIILANLPSAAIYEVVDDYDQDRYAAVKAVRGLAGWLERPWHKAAPAAELEGLKDEMPTHVREERCAVCGQQATGKYAEPAAPNRHPRTWYFCDLHGAEFRNLGVAWPAPVEGPCPLLHTHCGSCGCAITETGECHCGDNDYKTIGTGERDKQTKWLLELERLRGVHTSELPALVEDEAELERLTTKERERIAKALTSWYWSDQSLSGKKKDLLDGAAKALIALEAELAAANERAEKAERERNDARHFWYGQRIINDLLKFCDIRCVRCGSIYRHTNEAEQCDLPGQPTHEWSPHRTAALEAERDKLILANDCENEEAARAEAVKYLGEEAMGNSDCVPGVVELVKMLGAELDKLRGERDAADRELLKLQEWLIAHESLWTCMSGSPVNVAIAVMSRLALSNPKDEVASE